MRFIRQDEACDIAGVAPITLNSWRKSGKIVYRYLPGKYIYYDIDSIGSKGKTGHYLADHIMNTFYKSQVFNDKFIKYILQFDEFAQSFKCNKNFSRRAKQSIEQSGEPEYRWSKVVYIPDRDVYVNWDEDIEQVIYDSVMGEFMKMVEVVGGYNMYKDMSSGGEVMNLDFSNRLLDRYIMVGNSEDTMQEVNMKYIGVEQMDRGQRIQKIKDQLMKGVNKVRVEGRDVWVVVGQRIWNLIKEDIEHVDILQIRQGLQYGMNCKRSVYRVGKLDEGVYIYVNVKDRLSGRVLIGNRLMMDGNKYRAEMCDNLQDGIALKYDYRLVWKICRLIGTRAEVKLRYDMDMVGENGYKNYYMFDIELGDEEELEGDEVSLDENAMKMEIISRVVGLMDRGELNIILNRLRRKGIGK